MQVKQSALDSPTMKRRIEQARNHDFIGMDKENTDVFLII